MSAPFRRLLPLLVLAVLLVSPVQAQKRRAVRSPGPTPPAGGNCHTFNYVRAGLKASYLTTQASGNATFTITYIFDNANQTKTTQVVTTAQATANAETLIDGEAFGANLRGIKHINVKTTTQVPVLGSITLVNDINFVPSLTAGPMGGWCTGATWSVPSVTETLTTSGSPVPVPPQIITTIASTGEVLAVGESLTVPGGTFNTVKYRGALVSGTSVQTAITWVSMADNIVVRQDTLDAGGNVTSVTNLTNLQ
ncbi:MAG: hypothetical protein ABI779_06535 [Acidobacteriota bacterium]